MRAILLLLALALLAAAPVASAQKSGVITFNGRSPQGALHPGSAVDATYTATLVADATAYASTPGVPVHYAIAKAPAWATVTLSPSEDIFPTPVGVGALSPTYTAVRPLSVHFAIAGDLPQEGRIMGLVQIVAATSGSSMGTLTGSLSIPLMVDTGAAPCPAGTIATQDAGAVPTGPAMGAYGLAGLAAFGVGLAVALRARRAGVALAVLAVLVVPVLPVASAQKTGSIVFSPMAFTDPLHPGSVQTRTSTMTIVADLTSYTGIIGVPYYLHVAEAPAWATVVVNPPTGIFPVQPGAQSISPTFTATVPISVTVLVGDLNFTEARVGRITLVATTAGNSFGSVMGAMSFAVGVVSPARCAAAPAPSTSLSSAAAKPDAPATDPLIRQQTSSATAIPTAGYAVVGGCAIAGAGLGLALSRRGRR
ncbi:MAG: hypothetical protein QOE90_3092 [Thermoplasmata archaeon]|jgi:hypothetical protein|nr:hypothetical protein [Thermoplasmata archaeon]